MRVTTLLSLDDEGNLIGTTEGGGRSVREMDSKSGKSWLFILGRGPAGCDRVFAVGTNANKVASRALGGIFSGGRASEMEIPDKERIAMPKFMVTHTLPPKGISRDQFCQISIATQQDPNVKCHESFANLTEGKAFCYWDAPRPEELEAWFSKMNVPYDTITRLEHIAEGADVKDV